MSRLRTSFFFILAITTFAFIVHENWSREPDAATTTEKGSQLSLPELLTDIQVRYLLGFKGLLDHGEELIPKDFPPNILAAERMAYETTVRGVADSALDKNNSEQRSPMITPHATRKLAVFFTYIGYKDKATQLLEHATSSAPEAAETLGLKHALGPLLEGTTLPDLTDAERKALETDLGWTYRLLHVQTLNAEARAKFESEQIMEPAMQAALGFLALFIAFMCCAFFGFIFFMFYSVQALRGKFYSRYETSEIPTNFNLEVFTIYLIGMAGVGRVIHLVLDNYPQLVGKLGPHGLFILNIAGIAFTLLALLWPAFWGVDTKRFLRSLGLSTGGTESRGIGSLIGNAFRGPIGYLAAWIPAVPLLVIYSVALQILHIDSSGAAHPVIPILLGDGGKSSFVPIFILAVVIAPIVEEIMFRGALYGYLRANLGRTGAIILSSLIFATVHPQGPIGVFPLTMIGMFLASLREWRGTLVTSMFAHACVNAGTLLAVSTILT